LIDEDRLAELLLDWEEAWAKGVDISCDELCKACPHLRDSLFEQINRLKATAWINSSDQAELDPSNSDRSPHVPPTIQDRYRIESLLGQGGFGQVYKACDLKLGRAVAVKVPKSRNLDLNERLQEEARRLAKLRHLGIVGVHDVGIDGELGFIVTDYIDGRDLRTILSERRFSPIESARIVCDVADALSYAHRCGFIHRDIKPANILLDNHDQPIITDFGIAVLVGDRRESDAMSGTLAYMAPEQVGSQWHLVDARTDVYSLGVVFYEMLSGRSPYSANNPAALREQILLKSPLEMEVGSNHSVELTNICMRCLAKHPADRFESAEQLAEAIRQVSLKNASSKRIFNNLVIIGLVILLAALPVIGAAIWLAQINPW